MKIRALIPELKTRKNFRATVNVQKSAKIGAIVANARSNAHAFDAGFKSGMLSSERHPTGEPQFHNGE
jgi:hypothetical protein